MNKKLTVLFVLCTFMIFPLFSISFQGEINLNPESLLKQWDFSPEVYNEEYWENTEISLVTISKADPLYSWFGHSSLMVALPEQEEISFDYGIFSFSDKFYWNFALGRMYYNVQSSYTKYQIEYEKSLNRTVSVVKLNFTPSQKKAVVTFLIDNAKDENSTYLYHHYKDNCATRIRDIINYGVGGDFKDWAVMQPGLTYRKETDRVISVSHLWTWFLDFLQSGNIDRQNTLWEDMFLPQNLEKSILSYGKLGTSKVYLSDTIGKDGRPATPDVYKPDILFALFISALFLIAAVLFRKKGFKVYGFIVYLIIGLLGTLLFFMMTFTTHDVCWLNENILFINPFLLVMAVAALRNKRKFFCKSNKFFAVLLVILSLVKLIFPSVLIQDNWRQIITVLPLYIYYGFFLNKGKTIKQKNPEKD